MVLPRPRFRIYTNTKSYMTVFKDIAFGTKNKGDDCNILEREVQKRFGVKHSVCAPQARVGIYFVLKSLIKPGQEVILSPYTIADVINMVINAGAKPVFADTERETCNVDPKEIEKLITNETGAVMVTHLHGLACPMDEIVEICKKHNVPLVEDSCQAFGTKYKGKRTGTIGDAGIFSFGMYKNLIAFYGGMVVTNNNELYQKVRKEASELPYSETSWFFKKFAKGLASDIATATPFFQSMVFWIFKFGHLKNIRAINKFVNTELDLSQHPKMREHYLRQMTPMQARVALDKFDTVDPNNEVRIKNAEVYHEGLKDIDELILPPLRTDGSHIYTYYPLQYDNRMELVRFMTANNCDIGVQHIKNTADLTSFKEFYRDCPNARATAEAVILLPTYPRYGEEMIQKNISVIRKFFKK